MASTESSRRQVPFGGHQLAEYTLAAAFIAIGIHLTGRPALALVVGGAALAVLALVSKGPLAPAKWLPRRVHLYLDLVLAAGFALSPLLYVHDLQVIPIILSEAVAVLLVRMSLTTEIVPRPRVEPAAPGVRGAPTRGAPTRAARLGAMLRSRLPRGAHTTTPAAGAESATADETGAVPESGTVSVSVPNLGWRAAQASAPSPATPAGSSTPAGSDIAAAVATTAGRLFGTVVAKARDSGAPAAAARNLGRATGHARRFGRAARAAAAAPKPESSPQARVPPESSQPSD